MKIVLFRWLVMFLPGLAFGGSQTASFIIVGNLQPVVELSMVAGGQAITPVISSSGGEQKLTLNTTMNMQVRCSGGNVAMKASISSDNSFVLIPENSPQLKIPYTLQFNNNAPVSGPTTIAFECNNKSVQIPITVNSSVLPTNYVTGLYHDNLVLIITY
jgi:hypothetical protein